jgi:hypothetical protein
MALFQEIILYSRKKDRMLWILSLLLTLLLAPRIHPAEALDAEATRLEVVSLCQAMPYRCPQGAAQTTREALETPDAPPPPTSRARPQPKQRHPAAAAKTMPPPKPSSVPTIAGRPVAPEIWGRSNDPASMLVHGCAKLVGIDLHGTMNARQLLDLRTCIDLAMRGATH